MIDAKELRIGNLVYPIDRRSEVNLCVPIPFILMEIEQTEVRGYRYGLSLDKVIKYSDFSIRDIQPIELNESILVKCGFEKDGVTFYEFIKSITSDGWQILVEETDEQWTVWYGKYESWDRALPLCDIKYLHQLQNLYYALTGTELLINNI